MEGPPSRRSRCGQASGKSSCVEAPTDATCRLGICCTCTRGKYAASMDVKRLELTGPAVPVGEEVLSSASYGFAQADFSRSGTLVYVRGKPARQTLVWLDSTG